MKKIFVLVLLSFSFTYSQVSWEKIDFPSNNNIYSIFFTDSTTGWVGCDSGYVFKTTNGGEDWIEMDTENPVSVRDIYFLNDRVGWILERQDVPPPFDTYILSTTDGGNTWNNFIFPDSGMFGRCIFFVDTLKGFIGGDYIAYTENGGLDWRESFIDSFHMKVHTINFFGDSLGFATGGERDAAGIIWKTIDGGLSWQGKLVLSFDPINALFFFDSSNVWGVSGDLEGLFPTELPRTSNAGLDWSVDTIYYVGIATGLASRTENEIWMSFYNKADDTTLIFTTDRGMKWNGYSTGEIYNLTDLTFPDSLHGYASGLNGVFLRYKKVVVSIDENNPLSPKDILLHQNYPNPFNSITKIKYSIMQRSFTSLKIFDILGNNVAFLLNKEMEPGEYEIEYNAGSLPSGIYFYQIKSGSFVDTKKMILMK